MSNETIQADLRSDPEIMQTVTNLVDDLVGGLDMLGVEVTADTRFHEDLQLESVDLVALAGLLGDVYGPSVNLAEWLAERELHEVIELRVGDIVGYVASVVGTSR